VTVPELPPFDAKAANNAWRTIRRPGGGEYQVFGSEQFVTFVRGLRTLQDYVEGHDIQIKAYKADQDALAVSTDNRLDKLEADVKALQEAPQARPFP
jgi:hypothetical protein